MKKIFIPLVLFVVIHGYSQINQQYNDSFNELAFFVETNNSVFDNAQGSRYLKEEFAPAKINDLEKVYPVRFNVVMNTIEVKRPDGTVLSLDKSTKHVVRLLDGSYKVYEDNFYIDDNGNKRRTFFEKIHKGDGYELFIKENIKFFPKKPSKSSYEPEVPAKFLKQKDKYYVKNLNSDSETLIKVPAKKKLFLKLFDENSDSFKSFYKKSKLKLDNKNDIIKIMDVYFVDNSMEEK